MKNLIYRTLRRDDPAGTAVCGKSHHHEGKLLCLWDGWAWVAWDGRIVPETCKQTDLLIAQYEQPTVR